MNAHTVATTTSNGDAATAAAAWVPREIRALVIEDEPADAMMIGRLLDKVEAFRIHTTLTGDLASARAAVDRETFDVAFIDFDVAGHCGIDLVPELARNGGGCAPILLTGQLTTSVHERALDAGVLASLAKDHLETKQVEVAIRQALRARDLTAELRARSKETDASSSTPVEPTTTFPAHLLSALRLLGVKADAIERAVINSAPRSRILADAQILRHVTGDLTSYCEDTVKVMAAVDQGVEGCVDLQSSLLDALNVIFAERRRRAIRVLLDLHDGPLYAQANESAVRLALVDVLSIAIERTMPGSRIRIPVTVGNNEIEIGFYSDDMISRPEEVRLNVDRLAARCQALLDRCGGRAVLFEGPRADGRLGSVRLPVDPAARRGAAGVSGPFAAQEVSRAASDAAATEMV